MFDAAVKALSQILSPPMRSILWRSIGLALVLITVLAIGLQRLLSWFADSGEVWAEGMLGPGFHSMLHALSWVISIAAGLGVVLGGIFLMPAITSLVASLFVDDVADHVEREHYPADHPGVALPVTLATHRRRQDGAADHPGLRGRAAVRAVCSARASSSSSSPPPGCWAANISSSRRCGSARPRMPRRCARRTRRRCSPPACSSRRSSRSRSSTWRRRCSAWPSWSTCTSGCPARAVS